MFSFMFSKAVQWARQEFLPYGFWPPCSINQGCKKCVWEKFGTESELPLELRL